MKSLSNKKFTINKYTAEVPITILHDYYSAYITGIFRIFIYS